MVKRSGFKFVGGAVTCPPGFYCMDFSTVCFAILLVLLLVGTIVWIHTSRQEVNERIQREELEARKEQAREERERQERHEQQEKYRKEQKDLEKKERKRQEKQLREKRSARTEEQQPTIIYVQSPSESRASTNPDPRFAPLSPEQSYETEPDIRGFPSPPIAAGRGAYIPINVQTRGYPDTFQQIGLLATPGGSDMSASPNRTILPLFGRKLITNRDRWNYYTRTDGMNPVQVPVQFKRRNCDEDIGCDEITEGDSVGVPVLGQSFTANVFRYSTPRYLPVIR